MPIDNVVIVIALCDTSIRLHGNYLTLIRLCTITAHQFKISLLANLLMLEIIRRVPTPLPSGISTVKDLQLSLGRAFCILC